MAQTASMRATSLAASAGLLGAFVMVALTFTYELRLPDFPIGAPPVDIVDVTPPPPETQEPRRQQTVRRPLAEPMDTPEPISNTPEPTDVELTSTTQAFDGPPGPQTVTSPHWLRRPSSLQRYYPRRALETGLEGDVVLDCLVTTVGYLRCGVISETPVGRGFADSALRIAADHQMQPAMRNGVAIEGRYQMRVPFRVD